MSDVDRQFAARQGLIVWWTLWAAFQTGIFFIYHFLGEKAPVTPPHPDESPVWVAALAPVFFSMILRWVVLPRFRNPVQAMPVFVIGIALAESATFLGLFIFPAHRQALFVASVLGILQFIPFFARRLFAEQNDASLRQ